MSALGRRADAVHSSDGWTARCGGRAGSGGAAEPRGGGGGVGPVGAPGPSIGAPLEGVGGEAGALGYQRRHPAPNRLGAEVRAAARAVQAAHPRWSAQAIWEELEAGGQEPLPSLRTLSRWLGPWRAAPGDAVAAARRFEAAGPLELVQMDTTSGQWLAGRRMAYVIVLLDDYSRAILAARAVTADSSWQNLRVLEQGVGRYGPPRVLYSDNGSIFRTTRHGGSRFFVYRPEVLAGEAPTQLARALGELGAVLLTHTRQRPRQGQAGALEPLLPRAGARRRALPERRGARRRPAGLGRPLQRPPSPPPGPGCVPAARLAGHVRRPLPGRDPPARRRVRPARDPQGRQGPHHLARRRDLWPAPRAQTWSPTRSSCGSDRARASASGTPTGSSPSCHTTRPRPRRPQRRRPARSHPAPAGPKQPRAAGAPPAGSRPPPRVGPSSRTNEL